MLLNPGFYIHTKSGKRYRILRLGVHLKCPETGAWHKAVMYEPGEYGPDKDFGNGEVYVRTQKSFCAGFRKEGT